jgi:signal transduction histidine kinase
VTSALDASQEERPARALRRGSAASLNRRLSLRGRMLVMLVGVTTVLLLVMGTVSTLVLARRVDSQIAEINANLANRAFDAAQLTPQALDRQQLTDPSGYAVVRVPLTPDLTVESVPSSGLDTLTAELAGAVSLKVQQAGFDAIRHQAELAEARRLSSGGACQQFPCLGGQPFSVDSKVRAASAWVEPPAGGPMTEGYLLFVGQPVTTDPNQVRGFILAELLTGAALIALLAVGGEWLIGRGLVPLDQMAATANEITTRGDLTARMPDADDQTEVGRLGSSINTMLDGIQQAFSMRLHSEQKVREFAADASHELRTPLTTIRGYAELYRQGALGPDQLPNAMRRIEQEAQRMSTLVAELLELARLDRTSSLDLTETDLASVIRDAVADAVAVQPLRPVRAEAPPRLVAVVDEPRVRQVLANLLGNVRAHTPVTTPVAVRLGAITGGVLIEVADAGPGMAAEDAIRAFDRFHRAAGRSSDDGAAGGSGSNGAGRKPPAAERSGGSGLGLSIVQAIANAHGGRATLESRPGKGTKVRVWLPVRIVP